MSLTGGILCALVTPFGDDEKPDVGALAALIDRQILHGIHGLFVAGTSGEGPLMSTKEHQLVAEAAVDAAAGRVPVVIQCGAPDTRTCEERARHAEAAGADAVALVAPYFYVFGPQQLYDHYRSVADAARGLPHYIYENPERVGYSLGPDLVGRLIDEVPNIVGVKDTGDSIARLTMYLSRSDIVPHVYTGNNALVFPALVIGAKGAVSALANVAPALFVEIYQAVERGETEKALEAQRTAARLQACFAGLPYVPAVKHAMARAGLNPGESRRPHVPLFEDQVRLLEERLQGSVGLQGWLDAPQG